MFEPTCLPTSPCQRGGACFHGSRPPTFLPLSVGEVTESWAIGIARVTLSFFSSSSIRRPPCGSAFRAHADGCSFSFFTRSPIVWCVASYEPARRTASRQRCGGFRARSEHCKLFRPSAEKGGAIAHRTAACVCSTGGPLGQCYSRAAAMLTARGDRMDGSPTNRRGVERSGGADVAGRGAR